MARVIYHEVATIGLPLRVRRWPGRWHSHREGIEPVIMR